MVPFGHQERDARIGLTDKGDSVLALAIGQRRRPAHSLDEVAELRDEAHRDTSGRPGGEPPERIEETGRDLAGDPRIIGHLGHVIGMVAAKPFHIVVFEAVEVHVPQRDKGEGLGPGLRVRHLGSHPNSDGHGRQAGQELPARPISSPDRITSC